MKKAILISFIGMLALLLLQSYWLHSIYVKNTNEFVECVNNMLSLSIEDELTLRWGGKTQDANNPKWIVKFAKDMTPEERAQLKGDTITLKAAKTKKIGRTFSDFFTQRMQDAYLTKNPVQLQSLDSILKNKLEQQNIHTEFRLVLHDKNHTAIDSIDKTVEGDSIFTEFKPIGTEGLLYARATVELPISHILQNMLYSLIISFLIVIIVFACLYYQLVVIRRARQQLEEREAVVHGAIHDLKSPLHTVVTLLDSLAYKEKNPEQQLRLEKGNEKIMHLCETIESIQDVSRMKTTIKPNKEKVDLVALIKEVYCEMDEHYADKKHIFTIDNQLSQSVIQVNKSILERCLRNLMDNALKYADEGVALTVTLSTQQGNVQIAIQDTGWGIPKKAQKKLFTQFYRAKPANKPAREGYGIGLSSVRQLIGKIEGVITFISKEGTGSTFFINLPGE